jgi:hypothetical protein
MLLDSEVSAIQMLIVSQAMAEENDEGGDIVKLLILSNRRSTDHL